ncbi:hypothetical protein BOX15_Mlig022776g1, partial [Macrostomum lignano]
SAMSASFYTKPANNGNAGVAMETSWDSNPGRQRTLQPITTGASVLAIKYNAGVIMVADTLGSYGSLAKFRSIPRVLRVNDATVAAASGDLADMQFLNTVVENHAIDEEIHEHGIAYSPASLHSWLTRVMYNRRSRINPLWNTYIVAGTEAGQPFLGYVNMLGVAFKEDCLATGFGSHLCLGLLREALDAAGGYAGLTEETATSALEACLRVLYYRDCRAYNQYQLANVPVAKPAQVSGPHFLQSDWSVAKLVKHYTE